MEAGTNRYATTDDGVRIAYAVTGSGPVLVHMPNSGVSSLLVDRALPERARWVAQLSKRFTLVRYDVRGQGLSQRDVEDVSRTAFLRELEAVVRAAELERFALFGFLSAAYVAPAYAATHAAAVTHLLLWPPDTREMTAAEYRGLAQLAESDWDTFTETYAHLAMGWKHGRAAHTFATVMRESMTQEMWRRVIASRPLPASGEWADDLAAVRTPTLVMQRKMRYAGERLTWLTASIEGSQLVQFDGEETVPYLGNVKTVVDTMARVRRGVGAAAASRRAIACAR